jgi:hypothetical protein
MLVCKTWKFAVAPEYYEVLTITGNMVDSLQNLQGQVPKRLSYFGEKTQRLVVYQGATEDQFFTQPNIRALLLSYLPNLKIIDLTNCENVMSFISSHSRILSNNSIEMKHVQQVIIGPEYFEVPVLQQKSFKIFDIVPPIYSWILQLYFVKKCIGSSFSFYKLDSSFGHQ